jgi:rhomboid family GlyGly-CTERM serine protease
LGQAPWTIGATLLMVFLNLGLFSWAPTASQKLIELLQYDRAAILDGQVWRLVSGNLVHWSPEHFFLDVGVFLLVGLLYERLLKPVYPWLLAGMGLALGLCLLVFQPELATYRGLSGVDSGQFAAALAVEVALARQMPWRWLWVLPAALVFVLKIGFEFLTGRMFFGTESLGNIGMPVPLVHVAGAMLALVAMVASRGQSFQRWTQTA